MSRYLAPAKVNLALHISSPRDDGYHPIESLIQTLDLLDLLEVSAADEDRLEIAGDSEIEPEDNLVTRALKLVRQDTEVAPIRFRLEKVIPIEAGLGGGSSDAAAALVAVVDLARLSSDLPGRLAPALGADVPFFLEGGTRMVTGVGEILEEVPALTDFAIALAVPDFGLSTSAVYRRWDEMEGPIGEEIALTRLPPSLRDGIPIRNDLQPAALDLEPRLGDFMADLRSQWGAPVMMSGSGSACFSLFATTEEAADAGRAMSGQCRFSGGVSLRDSGVGRE